MAMVDGSLNFDTKLDPSGFQQGANSLGQFVKGLTAFQLLKQGFQQIAALTGEAVQRLDTLNRFPKVLQTMGYSATDAADATGKLRDGVIGLPTTLQDIVKSAQGFTVLSGNLEESTDLALALNNAFIASGSTTADVSRGLDQYTRILSSGQVNIVSWRTLQETMGYALRQTAEAFGFAGESATNDLYAALQSGEITFSEFNQKIIELNEGVSGFAEQAKVASGGIETSITVARTRVVAGLADMIGGFNDFLDIEGSIERAGTNIGKALSWIGENATFVVPTTLALTAAIATLTIVSKIQKNLTLFGNAIKGVTTYQKLATIAMQYGTTVSKINQAAQIRETALKAGASKAEATLAASRVVGTKAASAAAVATDAGTAATTRATLAQKFLASAMALGNVLKAAAATVGLVLAGATWTQAAATTGLGTAWKALNAVILASPLGWILAIIVGVVAAIAAIVNAVKSANKEYYAERDALKALGEEHEEYKESLEESKKSINEEGHEMIAAAINAQNMIHALSNLIDANGNLVISDEEAAYSVGRLNEEVEGLGLQYDETTGKLNLTKQELEEYGKNLVAVTKAQAAEKEYNNILQERNSVQAKINALEEKKDIYNTMLQEGTISQRQYNKLIKEAEKLGDEYGDTLEELEVDVLAYEAASKKASASEEEIAIRRHQISNEQSDDVKKLSKQYGISYDQILTEASRLNGGLEQWADNQAALYTESGAMIGDVAEKWGLSVSEIEQYMDEWGFSLDEFNEHMKETHTEAGESIEDLALKWGTTTEEIEKQLRIQEIDLQTWSDNQDGILEEWEQNYAQAVDDVINSVKELPTSMDYTLDQMIEILNGNAEKYRAWKDKMVQVSSVLSPEVLEYLEQLGPGTSDILDEIINDTSGAKARELNAAFGNVGQAAADGLDEKKPEIVQSGEEIGENVGTGIESSDKPKQAAQGVVSDVSNELESGDYSGITDGITTAIDSGARGVDSAFSKVTNKLVTTLNTTVGKAGNATKSIMNAVTNNISNASSSVTSAMTRIINGIVTPLNSSVSRVSSAMAQIRNAIVNSLVSSVPAATAAATQIMNGIVSRLKDVSSVSYAARLIAQAVTNTITNAQGSLYSATNFFMQGMLNSMNNYVPILQNRANSLANGISNTIKKAWEISSPSKLSKRIMDWLMEPLDSTMEKWENPLVKRAHDVATAVREELEEGLDPNGVLQDIQAGTIQNVSSDVIERREYSPETSEDTRRVNRRNGDTTINIYGDVKDPDVVARKQSQMQRYGLAKGSY